MKSVRALAVVTINLLFAAPTWAGTEIVLHDFSVGSDGNLPADVGRLARDKAGNLYGTTQGGGTCDLGTVFKLSKSAGVWTETLLYSFCGGDGENPIAGLILGPSGGLYGTTELGGGGGCGTVFRLFGSTLTTLYSFMCGNDGGKPDAGVILDKPGNLYGTTRLYGAFGDANGGGTAYEISSVGTFSVIHPFCSVSACADGSSPQADLVMDSGGAIYGTTTYGGSTSCGCGTVFKLSRSHNGWVESVLHRFVGGSNDGANPTFASLALGTQKIGKKEECAIFGVTSAGGSANFGTVFRMLKSKNGYTFHLLHSFAVSDASPLGSLTFVKGKLIGTTYGAYPYSYGNVFQLAQNNGTWTESEVYRFSGGSDGANPVSGVVADSVGNLYGVTGIGGFGAGVVYEVMP